MGDWDWDWDWDGDCPGKGVFGGGWTISAGEGGRIRSLFILRGRNKESSISESSRNKKTLPNRNGAVIHLCSQGDRERTMPIPFFSSTNPSLLSLSPIPPGFSPSPSARIFPAMMRDEMCLKCGYEGIK